MLKYITFILSFLVSNSFSQELTATQKIPDTAIPGGEYVVEITVNKPAITGFMKFSQEVPAGCTANEVESKGGSFSFADGSAKIIWITPPAENPFTISYRVIIPNDVAGIKNINGKIAYLLNKERNVYDLEAKTIKIGESSPVTETAIIPPPPIVSVESEDPASPKIEKEVPKEEEKTTPIVVEHVKEPEPVVDIKKEEDKAPVVEPPKTEEKRVAPVNLPVSPKVPVTAIPSSTGKRFRVQIGAFSLKPTLKGVQELSTVVLENGVTKYFSGNFSTYEEASNHKKKMIEQGFQGAFIVSFENGKIVK